MAIQDSRSRSRRDGDMEKVTKEKTKTQKCLDWILMMDGDKEKETKEKTKTQKCLNWILMVSASPIAFLMFMLLALRSLLRFLFRASLLFVIVAINTPFAVMYNVSLLMFQYNYARLQKSTAPGWNWSDPRASVGIEVQVVVSDFIKVVASELLLVLSTGIITFYTAPRLVFYISTAIWLVAIFHKWLNTDSLSKTALSCLCDGYGLSPMMFLFSFIGLFDIGCHPVAKCSFSASRAFLFLDIYDINLPVHEVVCPSPQFAPFSIQEKGVAERDIEEGHRKFDGEVAHFQPFSIQEKVVAEHDIDEGENELSGEGARHRFQPFSTREKVVAGSNIEEGENELSGEGARHRFQPFSTREKVVAGSDIEEGENELCGEGARHRFQPFSTQEKDVARSDSEEGQNPFNGEGARHRFQPFSTQEKGWSDFEEGQNPVLGELPLYRFNAAKIKREPPVVEFLKWNAFERGLFQLNPRINFDIRENGKVILESFMVLRLLHNVICEYPVERLELPEDYFKTNELFNFLDHLSSDDGFVTDKMGGRYEHSLTLLEIVEGVHKNFGYRIMKPKDARFVVALPTKKSE